MRSRHGWRLFDDGAQRKASISVSITSRSSGFALKCRSLRRLINTSSTCGIVPVSPAQTGMRQCIQSPKEEEHMNRVWTGAALAGMLHVLAGSVAFAQSADTFPARPLRVITGFAPGGVSDTIARV